MTAFQNTFETGLSSGTAITTANSDDGSAGDALVVTDTSTNSTCLFDSSRAWQGTLSARLFANTNSGQLTVQIGATSGTPGATLAFRGYFQVDTFPSSTLPFVTIRTAAGAAVATIRMVTGASTMSVLNSSGVASGTFTGTAPALDTWHRLEFWITPATSTTGRIQADVYVGDSLTPIHSFTSSVLNFGTSPAGHVVLGKLTGTATQITFWDAIATNDALGENYIGPYVAPPQSIAATIPVATTVAASVTSKLPAAATTAVVSTVSATMAQRMPAAATTPVISAVATAASKLTPAVVTIPVVSTVAAMATRGTPASVAFAVVSTVTADAEVATATTVDITSVTEVISDFQRNGASPQTRTPTFAGPYEQERWIVGIISRRSETSGIDVTINGEPVDSYGFWAGNGFGYTAFVARPTTDPTFTVAWTTTSTTSETTIVCWEVRSKGKPTPLDAQLSAPNLVTVATDPEAVAMASAIQSTGTLPTNEFAMVLDSSAAGWFFFTGLVYPADGSSLDLDVVNSAGLGMSIVSTECLWSDTWSDTWCSAATQSISATIDVVSASSAVATKLTPATTTIPVVSTVAATATKRTPASTAIPVVSTVTAAASKLTPGSVTIPVVSTVSAAATKLTPASVVVPVVSTVSAAMEVATDQFPISATIDIVSSVSATVQARLVAAATTPVVSTVSAAVTLRTSIGATVAVLSSVSAAMAARLQASTTIPIITTTSGTVLALRPFSAVIPVVSTVTADPVAIHPVSATVAVVSTVSAAMSPAGSSSVTIPVQSTVAADMRLRAVAAATIPVVSAVSVDAKAIHPVSATVAVVSTVQATVRQNLAIGATVPVVATVAIDVTALLYASVVIAVISTVQASFTSGTARPAYIRGEEVIAIYYGSTPIVRTYLGDEIIWAP